MTVKPERRARFTLVMLSMLIVCASQTAQANEAGKIIFAKGPVSAERDPPVPLAKGDSILVADEIVTGEAARAQLLMLDGAKIAIRPNSRLLIEEFLYASGESAPEGTPVASASHDRAVYRLIKGGFRSITGAIGKENEADYEVRSPVGVLGIRGTDYTVLLCQNDCGSEQNGLHISVTSGIVVFRNEFGEFEVTAGQQFLVPLTDRRPQHLAAPQDDGDEESNDGPSDDNTPEMPIRGIDNDGSPIDLTDPNPPDQGERSIGWSSGTLEPTSFAGFSGAQDNTPAEYILDAGNNLEAFIGPYPDPTGGVVGASFAIGTATNVETGFDSVTMLRWGRWSGGTANITLMSGGDVSQDLTLQSLHWTSSPEWMTPPVMPITGAVDYTLIGNTSPTNNFGAVGVLGSATFFADFTNMVVASGLNLDIAGVNWIASGSGAIGGGIAAHLFSGFYDFVTIDGFNADYGFFSGFFSEPGNTPDSDWPGGVGLTYTLYDDRNEWVSGAVIFGDPVAAQPGL